MAALAHLFEGVMELSAENLGLKELVMGSGHGADRVARARDRIAPLATQVIERARAAGG